MFLLDEHVIYSASDLANAARCEFALLRTLDAKLGLLESQNDAPDPMLDRTARLGDAHELRQLEAFRSKFGDGVVEMPRPWYTKDGLAEANRATVDAAVAGADVIYQGTFFDGRFLGFCDFLVREDDAYAVYDTKLSRHAKVTALLQLAAYADALEYNGIRPAPTVHLLLGDQSVSTHVLGDLAPVYRARRNRLQAILDDKQSELLPVQWADPRYSACGRCKACEPEVEASRDLLLVAGMRATTRARLVEASISTIDQLATASEPVEGLAERTLSNLRQQAEIQLRQENSAANLFEIVNAETLGAIPAPDPGDIFFDFEGDPLWAETGSPDWGLEYLFGVVEASTDGTAFRPFWAHDRAQERQALQDFLDYVARRRRMYPNMHVYHYAAYEKSALLRLAGRYGVGEETVDNLLRDNVLVDLYPIVRAAVRIGQRSYSIKKLEPLYMGDQLRDGGVTNAADSIVAYADYCDLRDDGKSDEASALLQNIADYNEYDCVSTLRLRDWLLARADEHGIAARPASSVTEIDVEIHPVESKLRGYVGEGPIAERTDEQAAAALMAAAIGYHRREQKPFWWAHFDRLTHPIDEWADTRDVLVIESGTVDEDWHKKGKQRKFRRRITVIGRFGTGSALSPGTDVFTLYDPPAPIPSDDACQRATSTAKVIDCGVDDDFNDVLQLQEMLADGASEYDSLPMALTPGFPIRAKSMETAIEAAATQMCAALPALSTNASVDVLRRIAPRTRSGTPIPPAIDGDYADAITSALIDLDNSYVAVQGPPGTGKTYIGAHVIARLISERRWRIGVVAQSHAVVENMLDAVVRAGVPGEVVGKKSPQTTTPSWRTLEPDEYPAFIAGAEDTGCVIGGTAWDFANEKRVPPQSLDLLVIDEAGQFALANTIAVGASARNLLLLGDPQQLPQVSQGTHPEPVDMSALGWLAHGHGALPVERGYFLERTWRMHPDLCAPVSDLAYEGKLRSNVEVTTARNLDGVAPGLSTVFVDHQGNSTESMEEAREVVRQVKTLLGTPWTDPRDGDGPRPLAQRDVLVVAPYNAQVSLIRSLLAKARLNDVMVGTVDKFQGRQAAVVVVSMTASAIEDVPRGMSFLLSRNRLNVAISRGMWKAVLIRSRWLTEYLPVSPEGMAQLGAFMRLT